MTLCFRLETLTVWHLVMIKDYIAVINNMITKANGQKICPWIKYIYTPGAAKMPLGDYKSFVIKTVLY